MRMRGAILACGVCLAASLSLAARADEVDDLLAGRSISIAVQQEEDSRPFDRRGTVPQSVVDSIIVPDEARPASEPEPWNVSILAAHDDPSERAAHSKASQPPTPSMEVNLVPEPSAIALAALALLYFLVFFRRRHAI